MIVQSKILYW